MKKCVRCGQKSGIKMKHSFCWNCGGNVFEVTTTKIIVGKAPEQEVSEGEEAAEPQEEES